MSNSDELRAYGVKAMNFDGQKRSLTVELEDREAIEVERASVGMPQRVRQRAYTAAGSASRG